MSDTKALSKAVPVYREVEALMAQGLKQLEMALPAFVNTERFRRVATTEVRNNLALADCEPNSIMVSIMKAAQLGLEVGSQLGQAYLVPFFDPKIGKKVCELIPGYRGLVNLVRRSGEISTFYAEAVYEGDVFRVSKGTDPSIVHVPMYKSFVATHFYAVCKFKDGSFQFEVMSKEQIEDHRDRHSKQAKGKAWANSFDEMAKKTVIRRIVKMLPVTVEFPDSEHDDAPEQVIDVEKFQAISAAPDVTPEEDKKFYQHQVDQLLEVCAEKKINVNDIILEDYRKLPVGQVVALISIIKERINEPSK